MYTWEFKFVGFVYSVFQDVNSRMGKLPKHSKLKCVGRVRYMFLHARARLHSVWMCFSGEPFLHWIITLWITQWIHIFGLLCLCFCDQVDQKE